MLSFAALCTFAFWLPWVKPRSFLSTTSGGTGRHKYSQKAKREVQEDKIYLGQQIRTSQVSTWELEAPCLTLTFKGAPSSSTWVESQLCAAKIRVGSYTMTKKKPS